MIVVVAPAAVGPTKEAFVGQGLEATVVGRVVEAGTDARYEEGALA
jgi:hypothetical protein